MKNPLHPIPSPAGNPLIGNLLSVDAKAPLQSLMELRREQAISQRAQMSDFLF